MRNRSSTDRIVSLAGVFCQLGALPSPKNRLDQWDREAVFYLLYLDEAGNEVTDTWHAFD
jgi:hypothetical protein